MKNSKKMEADTKNEDLRVQMDYPITKKGQDVDRFFGVYVADPYRWLEDDHAPETAEWVRQQNKFTFAYLEKIPYRHQIKSRLETLWNYQKEGAPFKAGEYYYFYKNNGLQNHNVLYRKNSVGMEEVFLDPNSFSDDGTISLDQLSFSKDGSLLAYSVSEGGSDWRKIYIIDTTNKQALEAPLLNVKFSEISWYKNAGFYYSSYEKPEGSVLSGKTDQHLLYYHELGSLQKDDVLVFGATPEQKRRYIAGYVSEDDRYLFVSGANSTTGNDLYFKDLSQEAQEGSGFQTILADENSDTWVIDNRGSTLYLVTNLNAPNKRIVTVNAAAPQTENWLDLIPETQHVLTPVKGGGYFFIEYMVDAVSKLFQYDYEGNQIREIPLPEVGSGEFIGGKKDEETLYYTFTNYKTPSSIYELDIQSGRSELYRKSAMPFDSHAFESKQIFYRSKDGTKIPMIITHKKGLVLDGKNPTILYGYGGFNISLKPQFRIANASWFENGGVYAVPNIRGGGEYGELWHKSGIKMNKQNVFDDFIAAAEYLIAQKYTSSQFLAVQGGSNGGLLIGAVLTQRPDLMQVALPAVGVLDMLRYHTFTAGAGWAFDYGTAEDSKEMFEYLKGYSPVHNVKKGVAYPAVLVSTGDHDDRVVPAHSYKFAAELQEKQSGSAPVLIRIETDAGHGAGKPIAKTIEEYADIFSFTLYNMGIQDLPSSH